MIWLILVLFFCFAIGVLAWNLGHAENLPPRDPRGFQ